jgi:DNA-binding NtrC family response regulator
VALSDATLEWLGEQPWPGNVRSLEHAIERAAVLSEREVLEPSDFRPNSGLVSAVSLTPGASPGLPGTGTLKDAVELAERQAITAALAAAGGNRREAAKRLGVSLRTLFYKMDRYRID